LLAAGCLAIGKVLNCSLEVDKVSQGQESCPNSFFNPSAREMQTVMSFFVALCVKMTITPVTAQHEIMRRAIVN
jgi:hypothetical protein